MGMARWEMVTLNATKLGAKAEVRKEGMLYCKFNSFQKIISLEIMFDVMAFMLQLKRSSGKETFSVIPNTVQTCQFYFDPKSTLDVNSTPTSDNVSSSYHSQQAQPMVMSLADRPYTIVQVNAAWQNLTGYKAEDVVGKESCRILQRKQANLDSKEITDFVESIRYKRAASVKLLNYTKDGRAFHNFLSIFPLSTDSKITHYFGLTSFVQFLDDVKASTEETNKEVKLITNEDSNEKLETSDCTG